MSNQKYGNSCSKIIKHHSTVRVHVIDLSIDEKIAIDVELNSILISIFIFVDQSRFGFQRSIGSHGFEGSIDHCQ